MGFLHLLSAFKADPSIKLLSSLFSAGILYTKMKNFMFTVIITVIATIIVVHCNTDLHIYYDCTRYVSMYCLKDQVSESCQNHLSFN